MSNPDLPKEWRESVRENIQKGAELNAAFHIDDIWAATIASYGLFANKPAIIMVL